MPFFIVVANLMLQIMSESSWRRLRTTWETRRHAGVAGFDCSVVLVLCGSFFFFFFKKIYCFAIQLLKKPNGETLDSLVLCDGYSEFEEHTGAGRNTSDYSIWPLFTVLCHFYLSIRLFSNRSNTFDEVSNHTSSGGEEREVVSPRWKMLRLETKCELLRWPLSNLLICTYYIVANTIRTH